MNKISMKGCNIRFSAKEYNAVAEHIHIHTYTHALWLLMFIFIYWVCRAVWRALLPFNIVDVSAASDAVAALRHDSKESDLAAAPSFDCSEVQGKMK